MKLQFEIKKKPDNINMNNMYMPESYNESGIYISPNKDELIFVDKGLVWAIPGLLIFGTEIKEIELETVKSENVYNEKAFTEMGVLELVKIMSDNIVNNNGSK